MGIMSELYLEKMETTAYYHTDRVLKAIELWYPIEDRKLMERLVWDILIEGYEENEDNITDTLSDVWRVELEIGESAVSLNGIELGEIYFKMTDGYKVNSHGWLEVDGDLIRDMYPPLLASYIPEDSELYQWRISLDTPENKAKQAQLAKWAEEQERRLSEWNA